MNVAYPGELAHLAFGPNHNKIDMPHNEPNNVLKLDPNFTAIRPKIHQPMDFEKMMQRPVPFGG
jgi:hypothetical protein